MCNTRSSSSRLLSPHPLQPANAPPARHIHSVAGCRRVDIARAQERGKEMEEDLIEEEEGEHYDASQYADDDSVDDAGVLDSHERLLFDAMNAADSSVSGSSPSSSTASPVPHHSSHGHGHGVCSSPTSSPAPPLQPSFMSPRSGMMGCKCVPRHRGAVRMCARHGNARGAYKRDVTSNPPSSNP
jgi:hypothetical protein